MIDSGLFRVYAEALAVNADLVRDAIMALLAECEGMDADQLARRLAEAYPALVAEHGSYAAACAAELYGELRDGSEAEGRFRPQAHEPDDARLLRDDVERAVRKSDGAEAALRKLSGTGVQRVMERADETLLRNAEADPAQPKWALVPHAGACGWCVMLGSNGFMYSREASAKRSRHGWCKCTPVVDFDAGNPALEGYDPDGLRERYRQCADMVRGAAEAEWEKMAPAERAEYEKEGRSAHDAFMTKRITAEMNARDREWLNTGTCQATRLAANPDAARVKEEHPGVYADWQAAVSRVGSSKISQSQRKHMRGTKQNEREKNPSYFTWEEPDLEGLDKAGRRRALAEYERRIHGLIKELAGTGVPDINKRTGRWGQHEKVVAPGIIGVDGKSKTETSKLTITYGKTKVHANPTYGGGS